MLNQIKWCAKFEVFGNLNSSLVSSKNPIAPVDKEVLSVEQPFSFLQFNDNFNILVGRQNMRLETARLIELSEGSNMRLSFDMAQLQYTSQNTKITRFYTIPVQQRLYIFYNEAVETEETLSSLYWTQNWTEKTNTDVYIFYKEEAEKTCNAGTANDHRT